SKQMLQILLVEDDDVDAEALLRAFRRQRFIVASLTVVKNGLEALALLRDLHVSNGPTRPHLILLDINMPQMNGIEFLTELRQDDMLKSTIVFVLTTSNRDEDKMAAYNKQIAGYFLKSRAGHDFQEMIKLLDTYNRIIEFPPEVV
ncbi:MAG: response regulator, partial [Caldilineaceae bacterium]|nr:response regulator [Caldilineaceae bacterium]